MRQAWIACAKDTVRPEVRADLFLLRCLQVDLSENTEPLFLQRRLHALVRGFDVSCFDGLGKIIAHVRFSCVVMVGLVAE